MAYLNIATTICVGLLTGTEFAVSAFINPVLWQLEDRAQSQAIAIFARKLGRVMPFWYSISLLLLVWEMTERHQQASVWLLGVASCIWGAVIVLSVLFLVPVNNRMARLDGPTFAEGARREHRKWDTMHRVRIAALVLAIICFLTAVQG